MAHHRTVQGSSALLACLIAFPGSGSAAIFTVGTGAGCSHGTIQSALNAAAATPGGDTVRLTRSLTYQPEANSINDTGNLNLVGGFATCTQAATDNIKTVVSGAGGAAEPVLRINAGTGVVIKLRHLTITGGDEDGGGAGGGIYFQGDGVLEVIESTITNNSAAFGGGIYALGTGTNAELIISEGNVISANTARYSGGGISIGGPIEMSMIAPNSIIAFNEALGQAAGTGFGGGLHVNGRAIAYIGSSGVGGLGAIYSNEAIDGGGISINSGAADGADALVHLFTTNPALPVTVRGNYASDTGGGVYLQSWKGLLARAFGRLCAWDFRIEDNAARDGSAIYLNSNSFIGLTVGSEVRLNHPSCTPPPPAVRCASGTPCNTISANDAVTTSGQFSDGATIRLLADTFFRAQRFEMRGNRARDAVRVDGSFLFIDIEDCLLVENQVVRQLIRSEGSTSFGRIDNCTIARNSIGSTHVLHTESTLDLTASIIDQPGKLTVAFSGGASDLIVRNVLSSDITTLPVDPSIISGAPSFVNAANGDYHLCANSLATDFAEPVVGDDRDLDNQPRDQDLPGVPNRFGVRDLGAYELQIGATGCGAPDAIFRNDFE